jgi:predicted transcriptional regulator
MKNNARYQNMVLDLLLRSRQPMSIKEMTYQCQLTYHQVASCVGVLTNKGMVKRVRTGIYEVTEDAKLIELSPEAQIKILKNKVIELENQIKNLVVKIARIN